MKHFPMSVKELRKYLSKFDPYTTVMVLMEDGSAKTFDICWDGDDGVGDDTKKAQVVYLDISEPEHEEIKRMPE